MILIKDVWMNVRDLNDVSKIIREYYNSDLADELDKLIPEHTDEEYDELAWKLEEKDGEIEALQDENLTLENRIDTLEEKIETLESECE